MTVESKHFAPIPLTVEVKLKLEHIRKTKYQPWQYAMQNSEGWSCG